MKPHQTGPEQLKPDKPVQTGPDRLKPVLTILIRFLLTQTRPDQLKLDQSDSNRF